VATSVILEKLPLLATTQAPIGALAQTCCPLLSAIAQDGYPYYNMNRKEFGEQHGYRRDID
jgi:hypothetical protein